MSTTLNDELRAYYQRAVVAKLAITVAEAEKLSISDLMYRYYTWAVGNQATPPISAANAAKMTLQDLMLYYFRWANVNLVVP